MNRYLSAFNAVLLVLAVCTGTLRAGSIVVPNGSFESPPTSFAWPYVDAWQQTPGPENQQSGVFLNTPPGDPSHIDNCDGSQAAFLLVATNQDALLQDYDSTNYASSTPTHAFDAKYEVGKSYTLTVGLIGGGGNMVSGAAIELSLYYRDAQGNLTNVVATNITYTPDLFPSHTHFVDFQARVPTVSASDSWAGRHVGVQLLSVVSPGLEGGYWDVDNVRLFSAGPPALLAPAWTNGQFSFTLESEPGLRFEVLATTNLALPLSNWTSLGFVTNASGDTPFLDSATDYNRRFYRARQLP